MPDFDPRITGGVLAPDDDALAPAGRTGVPKRPRPGRVRLYPQNRAAPLTLLLADSPERGGGVGGWESSERPLRRPARWWKSLPEDTLSLSCILDIHALPGTSLESRLARLYAMGRPGDSGEPPIILVAGDVPDAPTKKWVIQEVTLGARLYLSDGRLRRQALTIALEGYAALPSIRPVRIKRTRTGGGVGRRRTRTVRTRKGDTLRGLAVRELGSSGAWKRIREWNPKLFKKTDPDARLRGGLKVKLK